MSKTQPARGMRDFLPSDVRKREYVIGVIKEVYQKYGFEPLETPSVENLETLTGKYGEEGNQLIFKILKRGEKLDLEQGEKGLSDLALRYDLTVPLARVVANYKNELPKFFKRYQIQPVWRADRPARGRYREFYQCDVDAIGSSSMIVEAELISAVCEILERLGFEDFVVRLNHRELLAQIVESANIPKEKTTDALVALDKLDKIGSEGVQKELIERGINQENAELFTAMFEGFKGLEKANENRNKIGFDAFNQAFINRWDEGYDDNDSESRKVLREIESLIKLTEKGFAGKYVKIDPSLARGLSYYTGAIFEIVLTNGDFAGSIGGGGRYDGLIGMFGKEQIPACGFSLGLERILVVMEERGMFPESLQTNSADVLITIWNEESIAESLKLANELRATGLRVLVYPEADKLGKQFKYAGSINVPYVCILGENELAENKVAVKNMFTGEQEIIAREEVASKVK
ncbi:MAG: histidine--tRNA ligase [Pyrinomonadaceae bacterium]|jgi:histidyl-tRNA synthetase|nr:histidine--tRNA ligase [Pyrinomonadaceae bacterium]